MIELGKTQCLNIVKVTDFGVYLGTEEDKVLLPKKQVPDDVEVGDALTVFVYRDSSDRLIATTNKPKIQLGELKRLKVSQVTGIGAFLDWGLEKDLLMPYKEQTTHVSEGSEYLVALYIDKSGRLAATMRINKYLEKSETLVKDSAVTGTIIGITPDYRAYVAVDTIKVCKEERLLFSSFPFLLFAVSALTISGNRRIGKNLVLIVKTIPAGSSNIMSSESPRLPPPGNGT